MQAEHDSEIGSGLDLCQHPGRHQLGDDFIAAGDVLQHAKAWRI
jgi:hypothetical protein